MGKKTVEISSIFTKQEWRSIVKADPSMKVFEAASKWQDGFSVANLYTQPDDNPLSDRRWTSTDEKGGPLGWREYQKKCWDLYRSFGPVNAATNSKADYAAGSGFGVDSDILDIRLFLKDLFYSYRNRLYYTLPGWMIRMLAEGEMFLLLAFDEKGRATVRVLEPNRIGRDCLQDGLITDPDDVTQTLYYEYYSSATAEPDYIPDIRIAFEPELAKLIETEGKDERSKGSKKFRPVGGYRRFILHWKNLTGIPEYKRDVSVLSTVLEAIHLYWNAIKWQLDHKKAQSAYTNILSFDDSPAGKVAWQVWNRMTAEERATSGLTKQLTPGSTLVLMPGLSYDVKSPTLAKITGENQDIINIAGAGARTPQDLWQGQSAGASHAALKSSRSPLEMEIENLQYKLGNFLRYEFLRACFHVAGKVGGFAETFSVEEVKDMNNGKPTFEKIKVEPAELVSFSFPDVKFEQEIEGKVNAFLGSQHAGLSSIGVSDERVAREMGIDNLNSLRRKQAIERKKFGEPKPRPISGQDPNKEDGSDKGTPKGQPKDKPEAQPKEKK